MKFDQIQLKEPMRAALAVAILCHAWPKFVQQHAAGAQECKSSGAFTVPVGHYFGAEPDDCRLNAAVELKGRVFPYEGGPHLGPDGPLLDSLLARLQGLLTSSDLRMRPIEVSGVQELVSMNGTRFYPVATATVTLLTSKPLKQQLAERQTELSKELQGLETTLPVLIQREKQEFRGRLKQAKATCRDNIAAVERQHAARKAEILAKLAVIEAALAS